MSINQSVAQLRAQGTAALAESPSPHLDSEVLLSYVLEKPREHLLAHPDASVGDDQARQFRTLIRQRSKYKPVAYLTHNKEFYNRPFYISECVHIPRPATEDLIDNIKTVINERFDGTIADIGTGSGCIAITLALEFPKAKIIASDISKDALKIAQHNAHDHGVDGRIAFLAGSLLEPLVDQIDIIAANLPYGWTQAVRSLGGKWTDDPETLAQPVIVYDGKTCGLGLIQELVRSLPKHLAANGHAFLEFDPRQAEKLSSLAKKSSYQHKMLKDTAGFERIIHIY